MKLIITGYDGLPIESSLQGLDINNSGPSSHYEPTNDNEIAYYNNNLESPFVNNDLPPTPQNSNQVAAWYDTDL